jgi:hypothetical protein
VTDALRTHLESLAHTLAQPLFEPCGAQLSLGRDLRVRDGEMRLRLVLDAAEPGSTG